jgi:predicted nucleic acid-binding protein
MNFVLDSSLAAAFVLEDEATPETDKILDGFGLGARAFVPALWHWEVANLLLMAERRKRIGSGDVLRHLVQLKMMPIEVDEEALEQTWNSTSRLAQKYQLTAYDAAYLEMAIRRNVGLGSLDTDLRKAAKAEKMPLLPKA